MKKLILAGLLLFTLAFAGCSEGSSFAVYIDPECTQLLDGDHPMKLRAPTPYQQSGKVYIKNLTSEEITVGVCVDSTPESPDYTMKAEDVTIPPNEVKEMPIEFTIITNSAFINANLVFNEIEN